MPTPKLSHVRPGQALSAATINAIIDAVNTGRIAGVAVGSGLGMVRGPAGVTLTSTPSGDSETTIAKVTTQITKATSATLPGVGELERYTTFDPAGPTIGDLSGYNEPVFSIDKDYKIKVNSTIHAVKWKGSWWVVHVDSCTSLDPT